MNALEIVTKLDKEICGGELAKAATYLADDFRFVGVSPQPLNKDEALGLWATIRVAMPDFSHNMRGQREAVNIVYATVEAGARTPGPSPSRTVPPCLPRSAPGATPPSGSPSPCATARSKSGPSSQSPAEAWPACWDS